MASSSSGWIAMATPPVQAKGSSAPLPMRNCRAEYPMLRDVFRKKLVRPAARLIRHLETQPGAGVGPVVISRGNGDAERPGRVFIGQAGKEAELDQLRFTPVFPLQCLEGFMQGEDLVSGGIDR